MARDRGVGRVREPELLEPAATPGERGVDGDQRKEAIEQHALELVARDLVAEVRAHELAAATGHVDRRRVGSPWLEERLLREATRVDEPVPLQGVELLACAHARDDALFDDLGECQVEVVAAEQQVIADRRTREPVAAGIDVDQREVRGAATDVEYQDVLARRELRSAAAPRDPRVERGLRLLEKHDGRVAGRHCRLQRELARGLVEGRGDGHEHVRLVERCLGALVVPRLADVTQHERLRGDRRQLRAVAIAPRQDRGLPVDARVTQPRLCRGDHARRHARALAARELPDDRPQLATRGRLRVDDRPGHRPPRQRRLVRREIDVAREVHERRQLPTRRHVTGCDELGDRERLHARVARRRIDHRDRGVGRSEIDPDQVPRSHVLRWYRIPSPPAPPVAGNCGGARAARAARARNDSAGAPMPPDMRSLSS